jgi:hypothetical protein
MMRGDEDEVAADKITYDNAACTFLCVFLPPYISSTDDRAQRVRIIKSILEAVKTESSFDSSRWTEKTVEAKLKKMAAKKTKDDKKHAANVEKID